MPLLPLFFITTGLFCLSALQKNPILNKHPHIQEKDFGWLDYYVDKFNKEKGFSGGVLIAHEGKIVFEKVIGWRNVGKRIPHTMDSRFNLGSGNKMFTAVAIAQLAEAGKLNFSDPIAKHLPSYPDHDFASKASIHDLLSHSSGLEDYWDDEYEQHWDTISTLESYLPFVVRDSLLFEPGTEHAYSNSGFIVLGLIIEVVSGMSYFDYVRQHIYQPAGMRNSDSYPRDNSVAELAIGYEGIGTQWYEARSGLMGSSAGGGFATLHDVLAFDRALRNHTLLSPKSVEALQSDKTPADAEHPWNYGYGFIIDKINGHLRIGHGGRGPGIIFEYYFYPATGYTAILFSNAQNGAPDALYNKISDFISDDQQQSIHIPDDIKDETAQDVFEVELVDHPDEDDLITELEAGEDSRTALYWQHISFLAQAINNQDIEAFHTHFALQDVSTLTSNESMFNFMVKQVIPMRGKIKEFHALSNAVKIQDAGFPIRIGTFHLADGYPGSISISLNEAGQIDHLSLFVHPQICVDGPSQSCPHVALPLGEK